MIGISVSVDGDFDEAAVQVDSDESQAGSRECDSTGRCGGEVGGGGTVGGDEVGGRTDAQFA